MNAGRQARQPDLPPPARISMHIRVKSRRQQLGYSHSARASRPRHIHTYTLWRLLLPSTGRARSSGGNATKPMH